MSKSLFEKLFEEVMQDETDSAQFGGGDAEGMGDLEAMGGGEGGGDEVTLTLDRETAQKLMDLLSAQLGGGEEVGEEVDGESMGGEEEGGGSMGGEEDSEWGSEDAEEDEEGEESEDEDSEEVKLEAPQSQYKPFNNKGESLQSKSNKVSGALAANATGGGKAQQTSQTPGTEKYMPAKTSYDDGKSMKVSGARASTPSGPSKSVFHP
jgi:hypothetical protein